MTEIVKEAKPREAAVMIVRDKDGRVLAVSRSDGPELALPGGMLNEGETPEQAAIRELREETCLVVTRCWPSCFYNHDEKRWCNAVLDSPTDAGVKVHVFDACGWMNVPAPGDEVERLAWLTPPELLAQAGRFTSQVKKLLDAGCLNSQFNMRSGAGGQSVAMDLAVSQVHVPGAVGRQTEPVTPITPKSPKNTKNLGDLDAAKRNDLPESKFAWPEQRKYPIHDAAHVRNAAARLAQQVKEGKISKSTASKIHKRIAAAGKKFGVDVSASDEQVQVSHPGPLKTRMHLVLDHPEHGHFEVRHMKDGDEFVQHVTLSDEAAKGDEPVWNQIATRGTFRGHGAGEFSLDDSAFDQIIRNFREVDLGQVHFDWEHASEAEPTEGNVPVVGAPAQAWIKDLKKAPEGLYALVKWLEPAKSYIREGKYRFVSPAIRFHAKHPVSGKEIGAQLTSVALTNSPFLRGLQPLAAKDKPMANAVVAPKQMRLAHSPHDAMPLIRQCLGLHDLTTPFEVQERCKALREMCMSADAGGMSSGVPVADYCDKLRDITAVPMGSTMDDMFDAVESMIEAAIAEHEATMHPGQAAMSDANSLMSAEGEEEMVGASDVGASGVGASDVGASDVGASDVGATGGEASNAGGEATLAADAESEEDKAKKAKEMADNASGAGGEATLASATCPDNSSGAGGAATLSGYTLKDRTHTAKGEQTIKLSDEEIMADSIALKDLSTKFTAASAEVAKLTLQLRDRDSKVETLSAENTKILKDLAARDEKDIDNRVQDAFETHKDSQKLTDKHVAQMKVFCKADRKAFDELYPIFRGVKKHLMRDLTGAGHDVASTTNAGAEPPAPAGVQPGETFEDTALRMTLADPNLSMADATAKALKLHASGR